MFLGLDLSITSTGFYVISADGDFYGTIPTTTKNTYPERYRYIADEVAELVHNHKVEFIGLEDYAYQFGKFRSKNFTHLCELRGVVLDAVYKYAQTKVITSTQLKKFATGKGRLKSGDEGKQQVVDAVNARYGFEFSLKENDIADACTLAHIIELSEKDSLKNFNHLEKYQSDIIKDIRRSKWLY